MMGIFNQEKTGFIHLTVLKLLHKIHFFFNHKQ